MACSGIFKTVRKQVFFTTTMTALVVLSLTSCQFAPIIPDNLEFKSALFHQEDLSQRAGKVGFGGLQFISGRNGPHRLAIVHIAANDISVISDFYHHSRVVLRAWTELETADLKFGEEGFLTTSFGEVRYERFSNSMNSCVQFHRIFNRSMYDDFSRERTIIAGYYCNNAGKEPDDDEISEILGGIRLDPVNNWSSVPKEDTSDIFAPKRELFEIRVRAPDGNRFWLRN